MYLASTATTGEVTRRLSRAKGVILDFGSGFGGTMRFLNETRDDPVVGVNISPRQNQYVADFVGLPVIEADFAHTPFPQQLAANVLSIDSMVHATSKEAVVREAYRVLRVGGKFVFTDLMVADTADYEDYKHLLPRIGLDSMPTPMYYTEVMDKVGFDDVSYTDFSADAAQHYRMVGDRLNEVRQRGDSWSKYNSQIDRMLQGCRDWQRAGEEGILKWGIFEGARVAPF